MTITRRNLLAYSALPALAGCASIFGPTVSSFLPTIQSVFAGGAVILETGAAMVEAGILTKGSAVVLKINDVLKNSVDPMFATAKQDVDSNATISQAVIDELILVGNQLQAAIVAPAPSAAQVHAMMARKANMRTLGFVFTITAVVAIVEQILSLAIQYGGPIATYIQSLVSGISPSAGSTAATVDQAYSNYQTAEAAWDAAVAP